jgi:hypothetical protein
MMTQEQFAREKQYQITRALASNMQARGLITAAEVRIIDAKTLAKYKPIIGSLNLTSAPDRANMVI